MDPTPTDPTSTNFAETALQLARDVIAYWRNEVDRLREENLRLAEENQQLEARIKHPPITYTFPDKDHRFYSIEPGKAMETT